MTDATVTPLRSSVTKDVTGPLRSRRARHKKKAAAVPVAGFNSDIKADDTVLHIPVTAASPVAAARPPWSVWPLAGTTVGLMAVSLTHLSDGMIQLTAIPSWQAWAMAIGVDCLLVSVALAQLTATPEVKRDIAIVARCMEAGTLIMSAGLNALAFTGGNFDAAHWAQVAFGCFVPAAISGATYILARLTRR